MAGVITGLPSRFLLAAVQVLYVVRCVQVHIMFARGKACSGAFLAALRPGPKLSLLIICKTIDGGTRGSPKYCDGVVFEILIQRPAKATNTRQNLDDALKSRRLGHKSVFELRPCVGAIRETAFEADLCCCSLNDLELRR